MKNLKKVIKTLWRMYCWISTILTGYAFIKARGTGKEKDLTLIGKAIDRMQGYSVEADDVILIDDTELHVSYNPYMHLFTNSLGSIACIVTNSTDVYTDVRFRNMHAPTQYAILCHEMGHRKHNHKPGLTYQWDRIKANKQGRVLPMELEADEYAVSIVGYFSMITSLKELATYTKGLSRKEILLRIKYLEALRDCPPNAKPCIW